MASGNQAHDKNPCLPHRALPNTGVHPKPSTGHSIRKGFYFQETSYFPKAAPVTSLMNEEHPKENRDKGEFGAVRRLGRMHSTPVPPSAAKNPHQSWSWELGCPVSWNSTLRSSCVLCIPSGTTASSFFLQVFPQSRMPALLQGTPSQVGMDGCRPGLQQLGEGSWAHQVLGKAGWFEALFGSSPASWWWLSPGLLTAHKGYPLPSLSCLAGLHTASWQHGDSHLSAAHTKQVFSKPSSLCRKPSSCSSGTKPSATRALQDCCPLQTDSSSTAGCLLPVKGETAQKQHTLGPG